MKIQPVGLSEQYGKRDSEVKSVLEENVRTVAFTTGGSQRLLCVWFYVQSFDGQASGTVLRLPARNLYWCRLQFPPHVWSECSSSSVRTIKACESIQTHFNALYHSAHPNNFVLVSALQNTTERDLHQYEKRHYTKTQKSATDKTEDFTSSKIEQ